MTDLFKTLALTLLTPECYDQYFFNSNFFHGECMKSTISKVLGFLIVAGSVTIKVPQILKIVKNKSGKGISLTGSLLELSAITFFFLYSYLKQFPFSAWGEGLFMSIQTAAVIALIFHYDKRHTHLWLFLSIYLFLVLVVATGIAPLSVLWLMQVLNLPIVILAKGAQLMTNYRNQSTGQLSAITVFMQFGGSLARVFTSFQETGDIALILTFVIASILNGMIAFQLIYYSKSATKKGKGKGKKSSKGKKSD